jgi:hypothetical protein
MRFLSVLLIILSLITQLMADPALEDGDYLPADPTAHADAANIKNSTIGDKKTMLNTGFLVLGTCHTLMTLGELGLYQMPKGSYVKVAGLWVLSAIGVLGLLGIETENSSQNKVSKNHNYIQNR